MDTIETSRLVGTIDVTTTTGDVEYSRTAIEVRDERGEELFHVVVDPSGQQQVLFFAHSDNYRISVVRLEEVLAVAKAKVRFIDET